MKRPKFRSEFASKTKTYCKKALKRRKCGTEHRSLHIGLIYRCFQNKWLSNDKYLKIPASEYPPMYLILRR